MTSQNKIVSQFRVEYWLSLFAQAIGVVLLMCLFVYLSMHEGAIDYLNGLIWLVIIGLVMGIVYLIYFVKNRFKQITIDESGIMVLLLLSRKSRHISYKEVLRTEYKRIDGGEDAISPGYEELTIILTNDRDLVIDDYQYKNYRELKALFYEYRRQYAEEKYKA